MSLKEQLETLRKDVLWYLFNSKKWNETTATYSIGYDNFTTKSGNLLEVGTFTFNNKSILEVSGAAVVNWIDWNGNYGPEMRTIFEALDVELHRFGKTWIGYLSEDPIPTPEFGNYEPAQIKREREDKLARDREEIRLRSIEEKTRIEEYYRSIPPIFNTPTTTTGLFTDIYSNTTANGTGYYAFNSNTDYTRTWSNTFAPANNRPPAANPAIASANQQGRSQRQIEEMIRRGRGRI